MSRGANVLIIFENRGTMIDTFMRMNFLFMNDIWMDVNFCAIFVKRLQHAYTMSKISFQRLTDAFTVYTG